MDLLDIKEFQKAYPYLSKKLYKILSEHQDIKVPIDMEDASLADRFFQRYEFDKSIDFGRKKAQMILDLVKSQPQLEKWLDILYPNRIEKKTQVNYKRKKQIIKKEIILFVSKTKNGYACKDKSGKDYTKEVNQGKLQYAFVNNGVIRGRLVEGASKFQWRAVKKKFVKQSNME